MNDAKRRRLEAKGWKVGSAKEFLGLTDEESKHIGESSMSLWTSLNGKFVSLVYSILTSFKKGDKPTPPVPGAQPIVIVNRSTWVSDDAMKTYVAALQTQINRDFVPRWRGKLEAPGYVLQLIKTTDADITITGTPRVLVCDTPDSVGGLGYHKMMNGQPLGFVFASVSVMDNCSISVTLSHEILEMLADLSANKTAIGPAGKAYALEVCDPCRDDRDGYTIGGVLVSDFVFPSFFDPNGAGPYDYQGKIKKPYTVSFGGYLIYYDDAHGWTTFFGDKVPVKEFSRRAKRLRA